LAAYATAAGDRDTDRKGLEMNTDNETDSEIADAFDVEQCKIIERDDT
jgi:hypothetical protein